MRKKLIAGNWKMNTTLAEAHALAEGVRDQAARLEGIEIVLCPPVPWLAELAHIIAPGKIPNLGLGGQNMHYEEHGAFTGEVSPLMIREVASYVILGHSERTHLFHEDTAFITQKLHSALEHDITPILCVGEDVQSDTSVEQVAVTVRDYVKDLSRDDLVRIIVAYEPVWAIGSGRPATPEYAQQVAEAIRGVTGEATRILYGGSVTEENAAAFLEQADIDGFLIGGTSLKLQPFISICEQANSSKGDL